MCSKFSYVADDVHSADSMPPKMQSFLVRENPTLQVFCPTSKSVVTSFESYLPPDDTIHKIIDKGPDLLAGPCWMKEGYDYRAFLPKENRIHGHLLASLKYEREDYIHRSGRWSLNGKKSELWLALDRNLTRSIEVVGGGLLLDLVHHEPHRATHYGFSRDHKSERDLRLSLGISRKAFIHRLAYLAYCVSRHYQWDRELVDQLWWQYFVRKCTQTWVDSVWDAIYRQWDARNFVGVVVNPFNRVEFGQKPSVRWLQTTLNFGVPIWVVFPGPEYYAELDGGFVVNQWKPTTAQVAEAMKAEGAKREQVPMDTSPEPQGDPAPLLPSDTHPPELSANAETPSPPANLPAGTQWFRSWDEYVQKRDAAIARGLEKATEQQKASWESLAQHAKKFQRPGKKGARVYVWETCGTGGFLRVLQTRFEVDRSWEDYVEEGLFFNPQHNTWDCYSIQDDNAIADGPPDDLRGEDEYGIMEQRWYAEPDLPINIPIGGPDPVEFLYSRYGFISVEPTTLPDTGIPFDKADIYRVVGLGECHSGVVSEHLNYFISSVLREQIPAGNCDLSETSPPNEMLSGKASIRGMVFLLQSPDLSGEGVYAFVGIPGKSPLLVVHDPLSVLQLMRAEIPFELRAELQCLLNNGSRFTVLYPYTQTFTPQRFQMLPNPMRREGWEPTSEDFRAYRSRLASFFLDRSYVVAAALSRGGLAWRIALEVLGDENTIDRLLDTHPDQRCPVKVNQGSYWCHELDEGEWFYLVGGYEVFTGV
jgi:hypothetical protein